MKAKEFPKPLIKKEKSTTKRKRSIISKSNPKIPSGDFPVKTNSNIIRISKNIAKIKGREIMPEYANAETNGIVNIYRYNILLLKECIEGLTCISFRYLLVCNRSIMYSKRNSGKNSSI